GEADGLMVYGIRPNSIFRKIGLRNGDIIKDINGTPIISKEDVSLLFNDIELEDNLKLSLFRRGEIKELSYTPFMDEDDKGEKE
ncbi:MAG: PDZ domain-containing protein, partial [Desulfobacula sp.]|nr:PDZ domain-containing protein [Desulfobacula sp.]